MNHSDPELTWMVGSGLESSGWFEPSEPAEPLRTTVWQPRERQFHGVKRSNLNRYGVKLIK